MAMARKQVNRRGRELANWFKTALTSYTDLLREAKYDDAVDALEEVSEAFLNYGLDNLLLRMVRPLNKKLVSTGVMSLEKWAWLCNIVGLTHSRQGEIAIARRKFLEMKEIGKKLEDQRIVSIALQNLGICSVELGRMQEARDLYQSALSLKKHIGDKLGVSQLYGNLANIHIANGELKEARRLVNASVHIKKSIKDDPGLIASYTTLGIINVRRAKFAEAEKAFRQALKLSKRTSNPPGIAKSFINIASTCSDQDKFREAIRNYQMGLATAHEFKLLPEIELAVRGLAVTYYRDKDYRGSIRFFKALLRLTERPGREFDHAMAYHDLGSLNTLIGNHRKANPYYRQALLLFQKAGAWAWVSTTISEMAGLEFRRGEFRSAFKILMHGIALILRAGRRMETIPIYDALIQELLSKGSLEEANKYFKVQKAILLAAGRPAEAAFKAAEIGARCLRFHYLQQGIAFLDDGEKLYRKLGEPQMLGKVLNEIGNALQEMEDFESARMRQREALSLARKTRDRVLEAQTRNNLGELERGVGNYPAAVPELRKTASICKSLHDLDGLATAYNNLGLAYDGLEKINIAKQMFGESLKAAIASGDKASQARALSSQGSLIFDRGRFNLALAKFKRALQLAQKSSDKDLEAQMWLNVAFTELRLKKDRHANRSLQKAVDLAQDTRNNKLLAEICLASAKENVRNAEVKKSGEYLAKNVILSLFISPQYTASSLQQLFVLVRELITEKNDDSAKNMLENAIKHLRKFKNKACRRLVNFYLLPIKNYLSQSDREPFDRFIVRTAHRGALAVA